MSKFSVGDIVICTFCKSPKNNHFVGQTAEVLEVTNRRDIERLLVDFENGQRREFFSDRFTLVLNVPQDRILRKVKTMYERQPYVQRIKQLSSGANSLS